MRADGRFNGALNQRVIGLCQLIGACTGKKYKNRNVGDDNPDNDGEAVSS
ncbi:MAG: hypothetical protein ABI700_26970 [Chloroflexota bacterium]